MSPSVRRFGAFEVDCGSGELRKHGLKVRLADQPFRILLLLLDRRGEIVTREEIRRALWPADTFVDFDAGLSSAVRKLRDALGDSAAQPLFIETVPRRGYRFIAPVIAPALAPVGAPAAQPGASPSRSMRVAALVAIAVIALVSVVFTQMRRPAVSPEADALFLKGMTAMGRENVAGFRAAAAYFERATLVQPGFAAAHAWLGHAQLQLVYAGKFAPHEVVPRADLAIRQALALDDRLALAHHDRAAILRDYYWQPEAAAREARRAAQLEPVRPDRPGEDPLSAQSALNAGVTLRDRGEFDRALDEFRRASTLNPQLARPYYQVGVTYALMGRWRDAGEALQRALEISPDNTRFLAYLAYAAANAGQPDEARRILQDLRDRSRRQYVSSYGLAAVYAALGERDAAAAALERAYQDHALEFMQWKQYPVFAADHLDPRYETVLRRVIGQ
jgi:DNA-binding winged helix-turn-helix (wHTH) protein/tetratricopeptide (TPR) repeat protein